MHAAIAQGELGARGHKQPPCSSYVCVYTNVYTHIDIFQFFSYKLEEKRNCFLFCSILFCYWWIPNAQNSIWSTVKCSINKEWLNEWLNFLDLFANNLQISPKNLFANKFIEFICKEINTSLQITLRNQRLKTLQLNRQNSYIGNVRGCG